MNRYWLIIAFFVVSSVQAKTCLWTGQGCNKKWNTSQNWISATAMDDCPSDFVSFIPFTPGGYDIIITNNFTRSLIIEGDVRFLGKKNDSSLQVNSLVILGSNMEASSVLIQIRRNQ